MIARATASGSIPAGERSRKMDADSRISVPLAHSINAATQSDAIGSKRSHPVARINPPATAVAANAARSLATCRKAPRTFRLSRLARERIVVAARLTTTPAS